MCLQACADIEDLDKLAQSDQGLRCPLRESADNVERINWEEMPKWDLSYARFES